MLSEEDKVKARHHMGYLNVQEASTFVLGIPAGVQTQFMIENAWGKILPHAENLFRTLLCRLDEIEAQVYGGSDMADVLKTGSIEVNPDRLKELAKYYRLAQQGLANLLGVVPNPFDLRDWVRAGGGINVPVCG
jgi:hypothetical protein